MPTPLELLFLAVRFARAAWRWLTARGGWRVFAVLVLLGVLVALLRPTARAAARGATAERRIVHPGVRALQWPAALLAAPSLRYVARSGAGAAEIASRAWPALRQ